MTTDEQIRAAFQARFGTAVSDVSVNPALLAAVRRRHLRQQRLMLVGAPIGVAALAAGSIVAANAVGHNGGSGAVTFINPASPTASATASGTAGPGGSVRLLDHTLTFPAGWTVGRAGKIVDLGTIHPAQPLGGRDQSATVAGAAGQVEIGLTMYRGPIAAAEKQVEPAAPDELVTTTIAGLPATVDQFGTSPACAFRAVKASSTAPKIRRLLASALGRAGHRFAVRTHEATVLARLRTERPATDLLLGKCPAGSRVVVGFADQVTTGITFPDGDYLMVESTDLTAAQVETVLGTALAG
jgi:hypothetical protein